MPASFWEVYIVSSFSAKQEAVVAFIMKFMELPAHIFSRQWSEIRIVPIVLPFDYFALHWIFSEILS